MSTSSHDPKATATTASAPLDDVPVPGRHRERTALGALLAGTGFCVTLAAANGRHAPLYVACGLLIAVLVLGFRLMPRRPFTVWVAWAIGAVLSLLLAWASPISRTLLVPWAGIEGAVGLILFLLWLRHRDGHLDWIVCSHEDGVLRREWSRRAAVRWARFAYEGPCLIVRADTLSPEVAAEVPLYPDRQLPQRLAPRPGRDR